MRLLRSKRRAEGHVGETETLLVSENSHRVAMVSYNIPWISPSVHLSPGRTTICCSSSSILRQLSKLSRFSCIFLVKPIIYSYISSSHLSDNSLSLVPITYPTMLAFVNHQLQGASERRKYVMIIVVWQYLSLSSPIDMSFPKVFRRSLKV